MSVKQSVALYELKLSSNLCCFAAVSYGSIAIDGIMGSIDSGNFLRHSRIQYRLVYLVTCFIRCSNVLRSCPVLAPAPGRLVGSGLKE